MSSHHAIEADIKEEPHNVNKAAPGIPYFTPAQDPPAGTALVTEETKSVPKLFKPLKLRGLTLNNRITVSEIRQNHHKNSH
jgi:hypothetical protein